MGGKGSGRGRSGQKVALVSEAELVSMGESEAGRWTRSVGKQVESGLPALNGRVVAVDQRSAAMLALRVAGFTASEISEQLGMTKRAVFQALYNLRRKGRLAETNEQLDHGIVPQAVEQLEKLVADGDKDAIFEVLKGRGQFKKHVAGGPGSGAAAVVTNLVVSFQVPEGKEKPVLVGQVVGVPREKGED